MHTGAVVAPKAMGSTGPFFLAPHGPEGFPGASDQVRHMDRNGLVLALFISPENISQWVDHAARQVIKSVPTFGMRACIGG